jgi:hypothetical protein
MGRTDAKVVTYNEQALASLKEAATAAGKVLVVDDLYAVVDGKCGKNYQSCVLQRPKNVHFEPAGCELMGEAVAKSVTSVIETATPSDIAAFSEGGGGGRDQLLRAVADPLASWDWRDVNGTSWLNPKHGGAVRDQLLSPPASWGAYGGGGPLKHCDACWAFSSMDVMAARIYIKSQRAVEALPATNFLYDCMPNLTHCGWQGDATKAYDFLQTTGAPDDSCSPIDASLGGNAQHCDVHPTPCPGICTPATMCRNRTDGGPGTRYEGLLFFVDSWRYLGKGTTVDQIMDELSTHGPIAAGMCVNKAWDTLNTTRRGQVLPASEGTTCNHIGHDVNYVGWGTATSDEVRVPLRAGSFLLHLSRCFGSVLG